MGKIKTLFLSNQSIILSAFMGYFIGNPFLIPYFTDFDNITERYNRTKKNYDVVVIDDGTLNNKELKEIIFCPTTFEMNKKIIYTSVAETDYFRNLISFGIDGIVSSKEELNVLGEAIIKVYKGEKYFCEFINKIINNKLTDYDDCIKKLTKREKEIITFRNKGYRNKDIANEMHVSVKTVENHDEHIKEKLGLKSIKEIENLKLFKIISL